ncbi:MAG: hypothetical protein D6757_05425 [Alphaproteobacteria bacterium]|nr:MAG: hypothetical protein D6757_05425 [Alphaproteobacteria bacterium]
MTRFSALAVLLCAAFWLEPAVSAPERLSKKDEIAFSILRHGHRIGVHRVRYRLNDDGRREIEVEARIRIKLAFLTLFRLDHRDQEVWNGDRLMRLDARSKRNRKRYHVILEAASDHYLIETGLDEVRAPGNLVPSSFTKTDFWIPDGSRDFTLLDTITGRQWPSRLVFVGRTRIDLDGEIADARHYRIYNLELGSLSHEFWIDDAGFLLKAHFVTKEGEQLDYLPIKG